MDELIAMLILCWMLVGMWLMYEDVTALAERESTLDELWGEDE